jgi:3-oxoadipate enol-lactonase
MAIRDADFTDKASSISVPTTCVVGRQDGATPPELVEATAKMIPGAKFEVIEEAGHIPCAEQPDEVVRIIREMIASL